MSRKPRQPAPAPNHLHPRGGRQWNLAAGRVLDDGDHLQTVLRG
jgi:hypothetical protein